MRRIEASIELQLEEIGMFRINFIIIACLVASQAEALTVSIGETELELSDSGNCIELTGEYDHFRIESTTPGRPPQLCVEPTQGNTLQFRHTALVATNPSRQRGSLRFAHDFASGPKGHVFIGASLKGFFAKADGAAPASGSEISLQTRFEQAEKATLAAETAHEVGDELQSALFEQSQKGEFVIAGPRRLQGELRFKFAGSGDRLVLETGTKLSIETLSARQ